MTDARQRVALTLSVVSLLLPALCGCDGGPEAGNQALRDFARSEMLSHRWVLSVRSEGPRWLGPSWWEDQGLPVESLGPDTLKLSRHGQPVPYVWAASPDGPGMLFYGETEPSLLGPVGSYTLAYGESGEEMSFVEKGSIDSGTCQTSTEAVVWYESDAVFRPTAPVDPPWVWHSLRPPETVTSRVILTDALATYPVSLTVKVWGQSSTPQVPDHHVRVTWNGAVAEDHYWDGEGLETWSLSLPGPHLTKSVLELAAPGETEAPVEQNWLEAYGVMWRQSLRLATPEWRTWRAEAAPSACWTWARDGAFIEDHLMALLVNQNGQVSQVEVCADAAAQQVRVGRQHVGDVGWIGVPWYAPPPDRVRPQETLIEDDLLDVDYMVVAPPAFHTDLAPLLVARADEGLTPGLVSPEAVYDTFGGGVASATAFQGFVGAYQDGSRPKHLLLVGDASADLKGMWSSPTALPTAWVRTAHVGSAASDYALVHGVDDSPLVAVGRLPVSSIDVLRGMVGKTLNWAPSSRFVLVSDDEPAFAALVQTLNRVRAADHMMSLGDEDAHTDLVSWMNEGPSVMVYAGHGSMTALGDERILSDANDAHWQGPTVIVTWSCLVSGFAHPAFRSLAETWLLAPGGAVAVVGPTGETTTYEQEAIAYAFQQALVEGQSVGTALLRAWEQAEFDDARNSFVLLGDPALRPMVTGD